MIDQTVNATKTESATRSIRAFIGFAMTVPLVAGLGLHPWAAFGMAFVGACLVFSSMLNISRFEGILACAIGVSITALMLANVGSLTESATIAAISIAGIGAFAAGLIGFKLPAREIVPNHKAPVLLYTTVLDREFGEAINDTNNLAA